MKDSTKETLDLMNEALELVPQNLFDPHEPSAYSDTDLHRMIADIFLEPKCRLAKETIGIAHSI